MGFWKDTGQYVRHGTSVRVFGARNYAAATAKKGVYNQEGTADGGFTAAAAGKIIKEIDKLQEKIRLIQKCRLMAKDYRPPRDTRTKALALSSLDQEPKVIRRWGKGWRVQTLPKNKTVVMADVDEVWVVDCDGCLYWSGMRWYELSREEFASED